MPGYVPAGNASLNFPQAAKLFAGDAPVTTSRAAGGTNVKLAIYTVIALVADKIVPVNPAASDGSQIPAGILSAPLDTTAATGDVNAWAPYYNGGDFNHEALVWPAAWDTLAERRAAFAQTSTVKINTILDY